MRMRLGIGWIGGAVLCVLAGCSSSAPSTGDASSGMCGAGTPAGQACNALKATGAAITPTCATGTLPAGQGGAILDGTYVLTAETYYNRTTCPTIAVSETVAIGGGCLELATATPFSATASGTFTVSGNNLMLTGTCFHVDVDGATFTANTPMQTFTATATTFIIFSHSGSDGGASTDYASVFTKQ